MGLINPTLLPTLMPVTAPSADFIIQQSDYLPSEVSDEQSRIKSTIMSNNHRKAKAHSIILRDKLPKSFQRSFEQANEKGASNLFFVIPSMVSIFTREPSEMPYVYDMAGGHLS